MFTIDPAQSYLTLSGDAYTLTLGPQGGAVGATNCFWGGTISASVSGGVVTFSGGSSITANPNASGPFVGNPGSDKGTVDNYGVHGSGLVSGYGAVVITGAYRDLRLDILAGTVQNGQAPSGVNLSFLAGWLDYSGTALGGTYPVVGSSSLVNVTGSDTSAALASYTVDGLGNQTLVLPVSMHTTGANRNEYWLGQLVAIAPVPEPSSFAILLIGAALLALGRRTRNRPF